MALLLTGTVSANQLPSTWVKLNTADVRNKPYQAYAYGYSLLDSGTYCDDNKLETCQIIKLDATPFTKRQITC